MTALDAFWYSALKFWLMTRYSWIALRGNGFPRLASCPATPPLVRSFLKLVPSMNRFTALAGCPPAEKVRKLVLLIRSSVTVTPGASAARSRKLRLAVGSLVICASDTFVATSDVRVSTVGAAVTTTPWSWVGRSVSEKFWICVAPIWMTTRRITAVVPMRRTVTS